MNEKLDRELENSESWDYERPEVRKPIKASRVVVSVAFQREDFARVSGYAEQLGKKVSEFIREAALEKATGQSGDFHIYGALWGSEPMSATTRVAGAPKLSEEALVTTH